MRRLISRMSPRITSSRTSTILAAGLVCLALPCSAVSPTKLSGGLTGLVRDGVGVPQMGATVLLFNHEERLFARALTDEKGGFSFLSLIPDVYSVRVSLRSFVPVFRDNIVVQPGVRSILNVNLTTLFSTIQLAPLSTQQRTLMSDEWKWVLRTSSATAELV